jgi:leucyl aminopeptidase (aminopeptidase T)/transposase
VLLSPEERARLLRWSRRNPDRDPRALRARIVLGAAAKEQDLEIATRLGIGRLTVARWRRRFLSHRLRGIDRPLTRTPRSGGVSEPHVREILRASTAPPTWNTPRMSSRRLARQLGLSHTTVRRVWSDAGVQPVGIEGSPLRPDPVPARAARDLIGVYLRAPDRAVAFALDVPAGPLPSGRRLRESIPLAPSALAPRASTFPIAVGETGPPSAPSLSERTREFLRFLAELESAAGRGRRIRVVATGPGLETRADVRYWLLRRSNVRLEWTEDLVAWSRRVYADLDRLGHDVAPERRPRSQGETSRAIHLFLTSYGASSDPFEWVASTSEVRADHASARLRYELSGTGHPGFKKPPEVGRAMRTPLPPDARARAMARVVLRNSLRVRRGEHVTIEGWSETLEFANALVLETLRLGARPLLFLQDEPTYWEAVAGTRPADLARVGAHLRAAIAKSDALVTFFGPSDRERYHALPRATLLRLGEYRDALYRAAAKAGTRAVQLALGRASSGSARMYGVDLDRWRDELVDGTSVDPELLHRRARRLAKLLLVGRHLEISHPNGTRLRLGLRHRAPQVSDGRVPPARRGGDWNLVQLPAGLVSVALDERVAEGVFLSNVTNSVGVFDTVGEVDGGRWTFTDGRLTRFDYERGRDLFATSYARGGAGKERVGLLSIGLNHRLSMAPLLRDQEAGALTLQLGRNDRAGGSNSVDWWAWLILRGADLSVDGTPLVVRGDLVE